MAEMFMSGVGAAVWVAGIIAGLAVVALVFGAIGGLWTTIKVRLTHRALMRARAAVAKKAREGKL